MRKHMLAIAFFFAAGAGAFVTAASAQEFTGSIYGRIVDPTNALLPGVSITVEGAAIQGKRTTESEGNGSYRLLNLPQGEYRITFQKSKFKKIVYEGAKVEVNKAITMNVTMQIANVEETLVVTNGSPIVDVKNATVGTNFDTPMMNDIPGQRDIWAVLALTPGITMPRMDIGGNTAGTQSPYRAYGLSGQTITTVDGVNITQGFNSEAMGAFLDFGSLGGVKISAAGNGADVAVAGAAITTVIKSGSNRTHGEGFADFKPANSKRYDGTENFVVYRDINGQLGGPFIKDKFWYFTSFRDQYTEFSTGMYDKPESQGGTDGWPFITQTTSFTVKLNYQLSRKGTLTFMTQVGRKYQPYRLGDGPGAFLYLVESTAHQNSWSHIGKVDYLRVLSNRATLDTSFNLFGTHFPLKAQTDKTPIFDDVNRTHMGAFETPSLQQDRRRHVNANLNLYAGRHDMKIGYMFQWSSPRYTGYGAPGPAGTAGHVTIHTSLDVPTSFWTDNGPVLNINTLKNHALFVQDKFSLTSKLTLNFGLRFDQYHSAYPEQRFGLNGVLGPFTVPTVTPARDVVTFNTLVPRIALIYDVFGNSKTALKVGWGRYATNPAELISQLVNPIDLITKKYAWDNTYLTADPAIAATRITPAYVATRQPIFGGAQLTPSTVDPNLKDSHIDEFTLGAEQEIMSDLRGYVAFIRKEQKNTFGRYDRLRTLANYTPVKALDPGPDGKEKTADDRIITIYETGVPPDTTDFYLTNKPIGDSYDSLEFGVVKRMRNHWQLISGFTWTKRDLSSLFSEDPNAVAWNGTNTQTTGWTFKASGSYIWRWGLLVGMTYNARKGEAYGRTFTVTDKYLTLADPKRTTPLVQGNQQFVVEKPGTYYLPSPHLVSMLVQKQFVIKGSLRLHTMISVHNLVGNNTITGVNTNTSQSFGWETSRMGGTVVRFSSRFTF
jgi:hypothetical protein